MDGDNDSEVELNSEEQALIQRSNSPTQSMVSMNAFNTLKQPLDRKLLDGRILKALQRQEERQNKKKTRLKQVLAPSKIFLSKKTSSETKALIFISSGRNY